MILSNINLLPHCLEKKSNASQNLNLNLNSSSFIHSIRIYSTILDFVNIYNFSQIV